ncbi:hypothetical protein [Bacteroidetes bacterium endosymbiont of Geopemphigus sp.]|nr:hypothetical protein [Bacteroidetes bacterium endosymbiont of Geopemphigus sp.]
MIFLLLSTISRSDSLEGMSQGANNSPTQPSKMALTTPLSTVIMRRSPR